MATRLRVARLDRITLVTKGRGKVAKHPELRSGVVEVVKADGQLAVAGGPVSFNEALRLALHGPQAVQKVAGPDVAGKTFDEALRALLHS